MAIIVCNITLKKFYRESLCQKFLLTVLIYSATRQTKRLSGNFRMLPESLFVCRALVQCSSLFACLFSILSNSHPSCYKACAKFVPAPMVWANFCQDTTDHAMVSHPGLFPKRVLTGYE